MNTSSCWHKNRITVVLGRASAASVIVLGALLWYLVSAVALVLLVVFLACGRLFTALPDSVWWSIKLALVWYGAAEKWVLRQAEKLW